MRVMLFRRHKDGAPVARGDLTALVSKAHKDKRSLPGYVIALAQRRFLASLGLEMRALAKATRAEADVKKKVAGAGSGGGGGAATAAATVYVLRSALPAAQRTRFVDLEEQDAQAGLTLAVLSLVAIAGDAGLAEAALWAQLGTLGLARGAPHPVFGDAEGAVEALVKQRYVQWGKRAQGGGAGEGRVLELAENGADEVGRDRLAAFVAATMKTRGGARAAPETDDAEEVE